MKKRVLSSIILMLLAVTAVQGAPRGYNKTNSSSDTMLGKFKFGPQVGVNYLSRKYGAFGEYELTEGIGLKTGLFYDAVGPILIEGIKGKTSNSALANPKYISMPITFRGYPGHDRQFCIFLGAQARYLVGGKILYAEGAKTSNVSSASAKAKVDRAKGASPGDMIDIINEALESDIALDLKDDTAGHMAEVENFDFGFNLGFNYEFGPGLILGLEYDRSLTKLMEYDDSTLNWALQVDLGYNIAALLTD